MRHLGESEGFPIDLQGETCIWLIHILKLGNTKYMDACDSYSSRRITDDIG